MRLIVTLHGNEQETLVLEPGQSYVGGRAKDCQLKLKSKKGISRYHFKIFEENGMWTIQAVGKFGEIFTGGQPISQQVLEAGQVFRVGDYELKVEAAAPAAVVETAPPPAPVAEHHAPVPISGSPTNLPSANHAPAVVQGANALQPEIFKGSEEATVFKPLTAVTPQARVVYPNGTERIYQLSGRRWIGGRDEDSAIPIEHSKASRKHFEIVSSPQGYFIRDLGSANGTWVNGQRLEADELEPLVSGDQIGVRRILIHFEVRDGQFESKLDNVPQEVMSNLPALAPPQFEVITFPVNSAGGAVRVDQYGVSRYKEFDPRSNRKARFYFVIGILLLVLAGGYFMDDEPPRVQIENQDAFSKLNAKQQSEVKAAYLLAKNLHGMKKYKMALASLDKIHQLLPNGFEDSVMMAEQCKAIEEAEIRREEIERARRMQEELRQKVEANVRECLPKVDVVSTVAEMEQCLSLALTSDPENPQVRELVMRVRQRMENAAAAALQREAYKKNVLAGKGLYNKAVAFETSGQLFEAVQAFEKHINSSYPDPDGLKAKSRASIAKIKQSVADDVGKYLTAARTAYQSGNFKEAMGNLVQAKKIDGNNAEVLDLLREVRREKDLKMQEIYSEAVILEGLSKLTEAKELWKKILTLDYPEEVYYQRSQSKLRQYGRLGDN